MLPILKINFQDRYDKAVKILKADRKGITPVEAKDKLELCKYLGDTAEGQIDADELVVKILKTCSAMSITDESAQLLEIALDAMQSEDIPRWYIEKG